MVGKITDVSLSETSDNDRSIALEGLIISSDQEGNDKTHNKNNERLCQTDFLHLHQLLFLLLIILGTSNVNTVILTKYIGTFRELWSLLMKVETSQKLLWKSLLTKNLIFNKPTVQDLDSYFIIHVKENSEVMNFTIANENVNSDSNITPDINESSSKYSK